jgi:hypothetical protein
MTTIAERVAAGAAFLDEREPGWWERINLDELDLHSACRCVLGQLATDLGYVETGWGNILGRFELRRWRWSYEFDGLPDTDVACGFNAGGNQAQEEYAALTAEWKRVIEARRSA